MTASPKGRTLGGWAIEALSDRVAADTLSLAGLRWIEAQDLFIGSAVSVPWLAGRCGATRLAGHGLLAALAGLPGAAKAPTRTLSGVPTRGVIVPRALVMETLQLTEAA